MYRLGVVFAVLMVSGCASLTTGPHQTLSVDTINCPAAACELTNKDGVYFIGSTPGTVSVNRACGELTIRCSKEGFADYMISVGSSVKAMAFGNILFGGLIGAGVDAATGAACEYPAFIPVPMDCGASAEQTARLDHPIPDEVQELAEKEECVDLVFVGSGPQQETVYKAVCEGATTLLTCDDESCGKSKIQVLNAPAPTEAD